MKIIQSPEINELAKALIEAQEELKNPEKSESGYQNRYKFAGLPKIIEDTKPVLKKNNLTITQLASSEEGQIGVTTILLHSSGQYIGSDYSLPIGQIAGASTTQSAGGAMTYARRYAYCAILNISADDDVDSQEPQQPVNKPQVNNSLSGECSVTGCGLKGFTKEFVDSSIKKHGKIICFKHQQEMEATS